MDVLTLPPDDNEAELGAEGRWQLPPAGPEDWRPATIGIVLERLDDIEYIWPVDVDNQVLVIRSAKGKLTVALLNRGHAAVKVY